MSFYDDLRSRQCRKADGLETLISSLECDAQQDTVWKCRDIFLYRQFHHVFKVRDGNFAEERWKAGKVEVQWFYLMFRSGSSYQNKGGQLNVGKEMTLQMRINTFCRIACEEYKPRGVHTVKKARFCIFSHSTQWTNDSDKQRAYSEWWGVKYALSSKIPSAPGRWPWLLTCCVPGADSRFLSQIIFYAPSFDGMWPP